MGKQVLGTLVVLLLLAASVAPAGAQADSFRWEFERVVYLSCTGEDVAVSGVVHSVYHDQTDARGGIHVQIHSNYQGISGSGLTSGLKYQAVGTENSVFQYAADAPLLIPKTLTTTAMFKLVAPGPDNDLLFRYTVHYTQNANGEWTAAVDNTTAECAEGLD